MSKGSILYQRAVQVLPGGVSRNLVLRDPHPVYVARAQGFTVEDIDGKKYIDFSNNVASLIHGHAYPPIVEAVSEQLKKGTAYMLGTEIEIEYAELLHNRVPQFEQIRFVNSGSEAVMAMIKAARAYTHRPIIAKAEGAYHGSFDTAEVSQDPTPENWGNYNNPRSAPHVPGTPDGVLQNVVVFPFNDVQTTINILNKYKDRIAAILIDPVPHRISMVPANREFIYALYDWTRAHNCLLCFDEVVTFRSAYGGAQEKYPVKPDLTSLGKIIGGGFPIGALTGRKEIMDILNPRSTNYRYALSGTFSANPISMTAGKIAMEHYTQEKVDYVTALTEKAKKQVLEASKIAGVPASVTGMGTFFRLFLTSPSPQHYRETYLYEQANKAAIKATLDYLYDHGIIAINSLTFMPSTVMTEKEIDILSEVILGMFKHVKPLIKEWR